MDKLLTVAEIEGILSATYDNLGDITPEEPNYEYLRDDNLLTLKLILALKAGYQALANAPCPECRGTGEDPKFNGWCSCPPLWAHQKK